jgi:hypothetical protein
MALGHKALWINLSHEAYANNNQALLKPWKNQCFGVFDFALCHKWNTMVLNFERFPAPSIDA